MFNISRLAILNVEYESSDLEDGSFNSMEYGSETERRRAIIDKVLARAERHGLTIDPDPVVNDLFDRWVDGSLSLRQVRENYLEHLSQREQAKADWRMLSIGATRSRLRE